MKHKTSPRVKLARQKFDRATSHREYRSALALARRLKPEEQLEVLDNLFAAADRLHVDRASGVPRVIPRGTLTVRGKAVEVEVLA